MERNDASLDDSRAGALAGFLHLSRGFGATAAKRKSVSVPVYNNCCSRSGAVKSRAFAPSFSRAAW